MADRRDVECNREPAQEATARDVDELDLPGQGEVLERRREAAEVLDELDDLPGSGSTLEARKSAVLALYEALRERGEMTTAELQELVEPDVVAYKNVTTFWTKFLQQPRRNALAELPGVEAPGQGGKVWRWRE